MFCHGLIKKSNDKEFEKFKKGRENLQGVEKCLET
jgi:hypothetical protein